MITAEDQGGSPPPAAPLPYEVELDFLVGEPDNCDCGVSWDSQDVIDGIDDEADQCECEIWDDEKERELHEDILRGLGADLDASRDPSRLWR
jgi:hypothetical protein